tara:strand:- start:451 stop:570 length:120 start_codon:yes stop_codon:yes gene_type:complete
MDDYQIALFFLPMVLVPLASWKITGLLEKLQKISSKGSK